MEPQESIAIFEIENQRFAIPFNYIQKVIPVVEIEKLPGVPFFIVGIINLHGQVVPVIDMRTLFSISTKEVELSDQLIIIDIPSGKYALLVDHTLEIVSINKNDMIEGDNIEYGGKYIKGVLMQPDGLVIINDVLNFLNKDELIQLESALISDVNK